MSSRPTEKEFKLEDYESFYEHHHYGEVPDSKIDEAHRIFPRVAWVLDVAKEIGAKNVLDIGCLEGYTLLTLANKLGVTGVGVDLSRSGIERASRVAKDKGYKVDFVQDYAEHFMEEVERNKFDLIVALEVLEHVKDDKVFLNLVDTMLAPGGTVLISTPAFESPVWGKNDVNNKCHIRLYTLEEEDYEEETDVPDPDTGKTYPRKATSIYKLIGKERIKDAGTYSELINIRYQ